MIRQTGKEIFIVTGSEDDDVSDIFITTQIGLLETHLLYKDPMIYPETRVLHGVLTAATELPVSFQGKSAFLVAFDPENPKRGVIVESAAINPEEISKEIENIIEMGGPFDHATIDIDDLFILYGYQLGLGLCINTEEIDEEVISTCLSIHKKMKGGV